MTKDHISTNYTKNKQQIIDEKLIVMIYFYPNIQANEDPGGTINNDFFFFSISTTSHRTESLLRTVAPFFVEIVAPYQVEIVAP